jgi:hypothetical protein
MAAVVPDGDRIEDSGALPVPVEPGRSPVVALLDGLPLAAHRRLEGRVLIDDPDGFETQYPAADRRHGTSMASLIIHGDLAGQGRPIGRPVYARPILRPDPRGMPGTTAETVPEDLLVVDLIHRAVRRIFESEGDSRPAAPDVSVINLSIGIVDRPFQFALSPLARLLDWLAWKYQVLFVVSAGNHDHPIEAAVPRGSITQRDGEELRRTILQAVAADTRNRRLLSPAEAVNALTVGAAAEDQSTVPVGTTAFTTVVAFQEGGLPSVINAQGPGYRRSIKPDVLAAGGRVLLREELAPTRPSDVTVLQVRRLTAPPGHLVAAPGSTPGALAAMCHSRGTSNAAALTSRAAAQLYEVLDDLRSMPNGELIDEIPRAVWLKALLVHSARWGDTGGVVTEILKNSQNSRQFREHVSRLLGLGVIEPGRCAECLPTRVTGLSGGTLRGEQSHVHRFPLPAGLRGVRATRRLIITVAWLTPVNPDHRAWRRAHLWFDPPRNSLGVSRVEADHRAVQRGTVQHEVLEGGGIAQFVDGADIDIRVNCRADAGTLEEAVPYALAVTLEMPEELGIDIYSEIRTRIHAVPIPVT